MQILSLKLELDAARIVFVRGRRTTWALKKLMSAGTTGLSVFDILAPRWSSYVHKLRKLGFLIETIRERHGGPFPGQHARYVLRSQLTILKATGC